MDGQVAIVELGQQLNHLALGMLGLSLAVAAITLTVTRSWLFAPLRAWAKERSSLVGELFSCSYCFSHWVSAVAVAVYWPGDIRLAAVLAFALVTLSAFWRGLAYKAITSAPARERSSRSS